MIKDNKTATGPPSTSSRRSSFLRCFGYSDKKMPTIDKVNSGSRRRRWISDWSFSCKKSKSVNAAPAKSEWEIQVVEEDSTLTKKHVIMVDAKHDRKKWTDVVKGDNGSFRSRRKETRPAASAGVKSPVKKTVTMSHPFVSSPMKPLTQSKSLPADTKKLLKPTPAGGGVDEVVLPKTTSSGGEFDSIIGMSILLAILLIMVLWGKLCAIICTCAWFSVAPRLVAAGERSAVATAERRRPESPENLNLESVEYKKKVVLEGLLQRNHRNVVGRL